VKLPMLMQPLSVSTGRTIRNVAAAEDCCIRV
jgi:hypothetical protein